MTLKGIIIGTIIMILLIPTTIVPVSASQEEPEQTQVRIEEEVESGFYRDDGYPKDAENDAINPDFAPDRSLSC